MNSAFMTRVAGKVYDYLTLFFLAHDYRVYGSYRWKANQDFWYLKQLKVFKHQNLYLVD